MKRYNNYIDTGIDWVGAVPKHWLVKKLKYAVKLINEKGTAEGVRHKVALENIESSTGKLLDIELSFDFTGDGNLFNANDVLFGKLRPYLAKVYLANEGGIAGGELLVLRANEDVCSKFLFYHVLSKGFIEEVNSSTYGSKMPRASWDFIGQLPFALPPLAEQMAIATFLDNAISQIDALIQKKQQMVGLLEDEKLAVINEAVSKGLENQFPMKESGIDWLGMVPAHWEVKKLKHVVSKIGSGVTPKGGAEVYQSTGIPFYRSQNIHFDGFKLDDVAYISKEIDAEMKNSRIEAGDVLLNITGASIGRCFFADSSFLHGNVNQHVCIIRPLRGVIDTVFLYYLIRSEIGQLQIDFQQTGANREGLNFEQLRNFIMPIPSLCEQKAIVQELQSVLANKDSTISIIKREIELMQEYRVVLISEAATGKIDVRDFQPKPIVSPVFA